MEECLMDDSREISKEETQATPEQPAVTEEETDLAQEVAEEPVRQEVEPANAEEPVPELTEAPVEDATPEEVIAQSGDEAQTQTPPTEGSEPTTEPQPAAQAGEALVEMIDAAEPQESEQRPAGSEQPTQGTDVSCPDASDLQPAGSEQSPTIESVIEAVLFASDEPLPESRLAGIVETTGKQVRDCVESLNARYGTHGNAFRIEQIAGGYQMLTQPLYNPWLKKMLRVRSDNKLSPAAMETLAIIAYKQPIIRADIEAIRGVAVGEVIRSLMYKGLVKIAGRAEILGRPMLYGTTKKFLEIFGLNSIKDLPKAEDLKNPDRV
jgi:segregation and condensation protein B